MKENNKKPNSQFSLNQTVSQRGKIKRRVNLFLIHYFRWLNIVLVFLILILGFIFLIYPKYSEVSGVVKESKDKKQSEYLEGKRQLNELEKLVDIYKSINKSDLRKVKLMLPVEEVHEAVFTQLELIVNRNGLILTSLEMESVDRQNDEEVAKKKKLGIERDFTVDLPPEIKKLRINLSVIGIDYLGLKSLIKDIENNLRLMDIVSLSFNTSTNSAGFTIYTYYLEK